MKDKLMVLNLEDNPNDTELILASLEEGGIPCEITRVDTERDFVSTLARECFDLFLIDYNLPSFDGLSALTIARQLGPDVPFIFVSASIGIEALKHGALDYVLKSNLSRLAPAVRRALKEVEKKKERRRAEEKLKQSEERFRTSFNLGLIGMAITSPTKGIVEVNDRICEILGYEREELMQTTWAELTHPDDLSADIANFNRVLAGEIDGYTMDKRWLRKDGRIIYTTISVKCVRRADGSVDYFVALLQDNTERKRAEQEREITIEFLRLVNESTGTRDLIKAATTFFQGQSGCEAVGIRLREGEDYPYFEARGFPKAFVLMENSLCAKDSANCVIRDSEGNPVIECMCGNVICGRFNPAKPFFTAHGSFWTNNTTELLRSTTEADRQARTRNRCNGEGYESVALLPLRLGEQRLGLLQLNDRRTGVFSLEDIGVWERLADHLAVALAKFRTEETLRESEDRYRSLFENSLDAVLLTFPDGTILAANQAACRIFGMSEAEICAAGRRGLVDTADPRLPVLLEERSRRGMASGELYFIRKGGTIFPGEVSSSLFEDKNGLTKSSMVIRDITDRKHKEEELQKLNRTLQAKSNSSLAMLNAKDETWYLNEVCRIIVEDCGHALVWIGFAEQDEGRAVRPVAHAGFEEGYLDSIKITWSDTELGRGPVGTAIRTGKPSILRNILANPAFAPWREEAVKRGYAAIISVPLLAEGKASGSLNIYSRYPDPFSEDEVQLLTDLAADMSYGITAIRLHAAQAVAEAALRESEMRYRSLFDNMLEGFAYCKLILEHGMARDFVYLAVNSAFEALTGLRDVAGKKVTEVIPGIREANPELFEIYGRVALTGKPERFETYIESLGIWFSIAAYSPEKDHFVAVFDNITERRRTEDALRTSERQYRQLVDNAPVGVYKTTLEGNFLYANNALARIFEYENADEVMRLPVGMRYKRPEDREAFLNALKERGEVPYYEIEVSTKTGKLKTIVLSAVLEDGFITGMITDITERMRAEAALRDAEVRYHLLFDHSPDGIVIIDPATTGFLEFNETACRQLGYSHEEFARLRHSRSGSGRNA